MHEEFDIYINTILQWIESCLLQTQVLMCRNFVHQILVKRFSRDIEYFELQAAIALLEDRMKVKELTLAATPPDQQKEILNNYREVYKSENLMP